MGAIFHIVEIQLSHQITQFALTLHSHSQIFLNYCGTCFKNKQTTRVSVCVWRSVNVVRRYEAMFRKVRKLLFGDCYRILLDHHHHNVHRVRMVRYSTYLVWIVQWVGNRKGWNRLPAVVEAGGSRWSWVARTDYSIEECVERVD